MEKAIVKEGKLRTLHKKLHRGAKKISYLPIDKIGK